MRAGRTVLVSVAVLLAVLVAGIWAVPGLLDWNQHRSRIEALATSLLGRPVRIGGNVTLQLLPQPILNASRLEVDDTGDGVVLTAQALRLRVALMPLLAGRIDAQELVIEGADLRLPWPPAPGALSQRTPAWLTGLRARLERSRITLGTVTVTGIDARFETDPETGTLSVAGAGRLAANSVRFTGRLARPGRDGSAGVEMSLDGDEALRDTGGRFTGQLGGDGALAGHMVARGPDLSALLPMPAVAWRADGRLTASDGMVVADELVLDLNGSAARGALTLLVSSDPRIDVAIAAGRLELDEWLPVLLRAPEVAIPTGLDLTVEAATLAGGTVRRIRGGFDFARTGVTARDVTALLPGDANLSVQGTIPRGAGGPEFTGTTHLVAPDLRTTLQWAAKLAPAIGPVMQAVPDGVLREADLTGQVMLGTGAASVSDLTGVLDGSKIGGAAQVKYAALHPVVGATLELGTLALDPWLPDPATLTPSSIIGALQQGAAFDGEMKLHATQANWRGVPLTDLRLEGLTRAGRVSLRRAEAGILGLHVLGAATIESGRIADGKLECETPDLGPLRPAWPRGWPGEALLSGPGNATLTLSGPLDALAARLMIAAGDLRIDAAPVLNLPAQSWSGPVTLRHPGTPRLLEALGVRGTAAWLGDGSVSGVAQVTVAPGRAGLDGLVLTAGSLRAQGQLALTPDLSKPEVSRPEVSGTVSFESLPLQLPAMRSVDPWPAALLSGWGGAVKLEAQEVLLGPIPVLHGATALATLQDGKLTLERVEGQVLGGTGLGGSTAGGLTIDSNASPPQISVHASAYALAIAGPLLAAAPDALDLAAGTMAVNVDLNASGHSMGALLATLSGDASARVRDGAVSGFDLAALSRALAVQDTNEAVASIRQALLPSETAFNTLELKLSLLRGAGTLEGQLAAEAGEAELHANIDFPAALADARVTLRPKTPPVQNDSAEPPEIGLRIAGPFGVPLRTPELAGISRWLALRP